jgi:hypothetical protein
MVNHLIIKQITNFVTEIIVMPTPMNDMKPTEQIIEEITIKIPANPIKNPECVLEGNDPIAREI